MGQTYITLNDGNKIPQFGLGVYQVPEGEATINAVKTALEMGIRHIDTAHAYQNERSVGKAIKESGIPRNEIWITTKLWPSEYGEGKTSDAIDKMLKRLDTDYIDLLLLHQQFGDYIGAYKDMQKAVKDGRVKSIGLSNFESERLEEVLAMAEIPPSVLQVECHPYYQQNELKKRVEKYGTVIEAWYPIGHGDKGLINEPLFAKLAQKYGKTEIITKLFDAYFTKNLELSNHDVLKQIAAECGLDSIEVDEVLKSEKYAKEVRDDEHQAAMLGIHGVPFFVVGGKYGLSGAQPVDVLKQAINEALTDELDEQFSGMTCGANGCHFEG